MMNALSILIETMVCFGLLCILTKKHNKDGIYIYTIIALVASFIMITKHISIMTINIPLGFATITSLIICGNLITQMKGPQELRKYLLFVLLVAITTVLVLDISSTMQNSSYNADISTAYNYIFNISINNYIALIVSVMIAIWLSSKIYYLLKRIQNKIVISNIFSIIITEFVENIIYVLIAHIFEWSIMDLSLCIVFRYIIKTTIGIIGTYPIYIISKYQE